MIWEERLTGPREHLALLFVVSAKAVMSHWHEVGLTRAVIDEGFVDRLDRGKAALADEGFFEESPEVLDDMARRLKLAVVSWEQLKTGLVAYGSRLDTSRPGDQTPHRLIVGLCDQIDHHAKTGLTGAGELVFSKTGSDRELQEEVLAGGDEAAVIPIGREVAGEAGASKEELESPYPPPSRSK